MEVSYELTTRAGRGTASVKLALGWIGDIQYEIIEPVSGLIEVYQEGLSDESPLRFHHVCMRVPDWAEFRARVDQERFPIAMEGGTPGHLLWLYLDARDTLGHYPRILLDDARALDDDPGAVDRRNGCGATYYGTNRSHS